MERVCERFSDDEGASDFFVGTGELAEDVVVALFEEGEVEDYVTLIWRLVVIFDEIELIVRSVDGCLGS